MDNSKGIILHDADNALRMEDNRAVIRRTQEISSDFLSNIDAARTASLNAPTGDFHYAGSIPVVIVEKWMAEGFNIYDPNVTLQDIFTRIKSENMERLIGTAKKLF